MRTLTYLSLGAGVQSTALLVMSNLGLHGCPRADVAIFADTQDEPAYVYEHLAALEAWSEIPVRRVTAGRLSDAGEGFLRIPAFTETAAGTGMLRRQCTREYLDELGVESCDGTGWLRGDPQQLRGLVDFLAGRTNLRLFEEVSA